MANTVCEANFPKPLIEELATRRCVIFLGSGVSATTTDKDGKSPLTWGEFVEGIKGLMKNPDSETLEYIDKEIGKENYLLALQAIYDESNLAEYVRFLEDEFSRDYTASQLHHLIRGIDSKIVITTNFDQIYESICPNSEYITLGYKDTKSIVHYIKSPKNLIIKAHGSIEKPEELIFTASQYYDAQEAYPDFFNLLSALFLTNTVVFIGYSLSDPDINLVLQFLHKTSTPASPHYLFEKAGIPKQLKDHWKNVYNVEVIEYGSDYSDLIPAIEELAEKVEEFRSQREGLIQ